MSSAYLESETGFAAAGPKPHPPALRSVRSLRLPFLKNLAERIFVALKFTFEIRSYRRPEMP